MSSLLQMPVSEPVARSRRIAVPLPAWAGKRAWAQAGTLVGIGVLTALVRGALNLRLGIPGHSIVLVVAPFVFGLACVPRRRAGAVMGLFALATAGVLRTAGAGAGALTSLAVTALLLEAALRLASSNRGVYVWCAVAGLAGNLAAFGVRLAVKYASLTRGDLVRPLAAWWPLAVWTYPLCGAVAGLLAAAVFFRASDAKGR